MSDYKEPAILTEIKNLSGNSPKLMGFDYFNVIYCTSVALILAMALVYFTVEDPMIKNMVLGQGFLSLGLILSVLFYKSRLDKDNVASTSEKKIKKQK